MSESSPALKNSILNFLASCDSLDETNAWDKDALGDMDAYFFNDILCTIIRLVAADGDFTWSELEFVNSALDAKYDLQSLAQIYDACGERIQVMLETELPHSIAMLQDIHPNLAAGFKGILTQLCQALIASDGVVTAEEEALAKDLIARLA